MVSRYIAPSFNQLARVACVVAIGLVAVVSTKAADVQYTAQQRLACMPDAVRFCSDEIPNASRVRTCMIANKSKLSTGCRAMFRS